MPDDQDSEQLLKAAHSGDRVAIDALFERYRDRLRRMVEMRLNRKLWGRVDPSDIVQEAMLQAAQRVEQYVSNPQIPAYLWLRTFAQQQLLAAHRFHLGTAKRNADLELNVGVDNLDVSSASLASNFAADASSPSNVVAKAELVQLLEALIEGLSPLDREILALRHFEQMGNAEVAHLLEISETASSLRFYRALEHLRQKMREMGMDC